MFENRVLRRLFGPKRDKVIGGWRKLHNEERHNLYCSPSIIRIINVVKNAFFLILSLETWGVAIYSGLLCGMSVATSSDRVCRIVT
jgi:hypothetical protein